MSNEEDGVYEELEDDFLLLANEGQPALVEAGLGEKGKDVQDEFDNKGVFIVRDEEAEQLKAMREELKKRFGGLIGGNTVDTKPAIVEEEELSHSEEEEDDVEEVEEGEGADEELNDEKF